MTGDLGAMLKGVSPQHHVFLTMFSGNFEVLQGSKQTRRKTRREVLKSCLLRRCSLYSMVFRSAARHSFRVGRRVVFKSTL